MSAVWPSPRVGQDLKQLSWEVLAWVPQKVEARGWVCVPWGRLPGLSLLWTKGSVLMQEGSQGHMGFPMTQ